MQIIFNVRIAPFTHTHPWVPDDGGLVVGLWFAHVTLLVTTQGLSLQCIAIYPHNSWSCRTVKEIAQGCCKSCMIRNFISVMPMQSYMPVWKPYHKLVRCVLGSVLSKSSSVVNLHGFVPAMYSCVVQFPLKLCPECKSSLFVRIVHESHRTIGFSFVFYASQSASWESWHVRASEPASGLLLSGLQTSTVTSIIVDKWDLVGHNQTLPS